MSRSSNDAADPDRGTTRPEAHAEVRQHLHALRETITQSPPASRDALLAALDGLERALASLDLLALRSESAASRRLERAERSLERHETLLGLTQALTHAGTFELNPVVPQRSYSSPETYRILGLTAHLPPDAALARMVHSDDRDRVLAALARTVGEGRALDVRCRVVRPDGGVRQVHARGEALRDERGRVTRVVGSLVDVTEQEMAQDALDRLLRELEDLRLALDRSALVATTDAAGVIQSVNDRLCAATGLAEREMVGRNFRTLLLAASGRALEDGWRALSRGRAWSAEATLRKASGETWWAETTVVPFMDAQGRPYRYLAILHDVSERKRAEQQLFEQNSLARLGEMAAIVAHEVRNPLAAARGALQVVGPRLGSERDRAIVGEVVTRLGELNQLIEDLLLFARPRPPKVASVPLAPLLRSTVELLGSDPALARVAVELDLPRKPLTLDADVEALKSVFVNLLRNACQAMEGVGRVELRVREDHDCCEIAVRDDGPGIPPELREKVLEPFFTTKHRGTGLGLPIARGIIERHRGRLSIECPSGGGTTVTVRLPLAGGGS